MKIIIVPFLIVVFLSKTSICQIPNCNCPEFFINSEFIDTILAKAEIDGKLKDTLLGVIYVITPQKLFLQIPAVDDNGVEFMLDTNLEGLITYIQFFEYGYAYIYHSKQDCSIINNDGQYLSDQFACEPYYFTIDMAIKLVNYWIH